MTSLAPVAVDFETEEIIVRPSYPPKPVSVSIVEPGRPAEFWAWGHPIGNNCTKADAKTRLTKLWRSGQPLVFHQSKFDIDVGETHLGLPRLRWDQYHDTLFLAFLNDPHSRNLELKSLAHQHLKVKPVERDRLRDWILENISGATKKTWGAHIAQAPASIVEPYAKGDGTRCAPLFKHLYKDISKRGMLEAYDRERKLMPILLRTEREGVYVYLSKLRRDVLKYGGKLSDDGVYRGGVIGDLDQRIRKRLRAPGLDVDKKERLADALDAAGVMDSWKKTKTGKRSVAKDSLIEGLNDDRLAALLLYRGAVATCVRTFMGPWLHQAELTGGKIYTNWNQVRQPEEGGARTGRLSSNPNFQNIPTKTSPNYERLIAALKKAKLLDQLEPFPMVRSYLSPDPDEWFINRDYSQQELRILGHYEGAVLMDQYNADPWLDVHELARNLINGMLGTNFTRRPIKDTGFGLIYGMGLDKLARKIEQDKKVAKTIHDAYLNIFPGLGELNKTLKWRGRAGQPIRTWGGREYYVEEPRWSGKFGRMQTFEYKLLNVLIQGSAADNTKQAIINYDEHPKRKARFILTVHDEFLASTPKRLIVPQMRVLREAMESVKFDVPMLSEGEYGTDWANFKTFDEKGKEVHCLRKG